MAETKPQLEKQQTEREAVIQHFVDRKLGFEDPSHEPVDLVMYLAQDIQHGQPAMFEGQRVYVERLINAGIKSNMAKELFDDVRKVVKAAK
jgi:hypothetical protein